MTERVGRATMRDVAALAGVSIKTVSRVVNDEPGVAEQVRMRVQDAVDRLDYRHHLAASNLRRGGGRSGLIGALLQDVGNSFSAALLRSLEDAARARGTAILSASLDEEPERERTLVHDLVTRRVDGLVLMPSTDRQDYLSSEVRAGMPVVFVDREPRGIAADSVTVENVEGAVMGTEHLLAQGHRRIACLTDLPDISTAQQRLQGFVDAHRARGVHPDERLTVTGLRGPAAGEAAVSRLLDLDRPPTAIFAGRNDLAQGAVRALRRRGLGDSVAIVGFDDFPLADLLTPPLTVIRQDVVRIGRLTADLLVARLDGDERPPQRIVVEPTLVVRGSGEIPPSD
ncbi:LacI family transcription regulator [Knoellia flava TL1]|uniref:LacI family transcriptional regulator n=2 Tax=Knoellia flava TaxID=913969 RepID=A0A8H9FRU8_9MICO|nr:LacI family DNA-binding transcriptional regulator [Knoellia flava]KGN35654.1 LacI family transcription regulator [Knoellia flava TL1]GGB77028.1 LacI family transcriptional regulator [Knoellia flava]